MIPGNIMSTLLRIVTSNNARGNVLCTRGNVSKISAFYYGDKVFIVYKEAMEFQELEQHKETVAS